MPRFLLAATLLAATPAPAQDNSFLTGQTPVTTVLADGWEITPRKAACTLLLRDQQQRPEFVVDARRSDDTTAVALFLFTPNPYTTPVQLTVVAKTGTGRQQIGRVTFETRHMPKATMLIGSWPRENILPRLAAVDRLDFFGPGQRLVASVPTSGGGAAVASLRRCLDGTAAIQPAPAAPTVPREAEVSWDQRFDRDHCSITQKTVEGNEIEFTFNRPGNLMMVIRLHDAPALKIDSRDTLSLAFRQVTNEGQLITDPDFAAVHLHADRAGHDKILYGRVEPAFLDKMAQDRWNELALNSYGIDTVDARLRETLRIAGSAIAVAGLQRCADALPD